MTNSKSTVRFEVLIVILLVAAIVGIWRGFWGLMDLFLFKDNQVLSYFASIVIGLVVLGVAHFSIKQVHIF